MIYSRIALATLVISVGTAGSGQAAGLLPDLSPPVMVQSPTPMIVQAPNPDEEHSAEVPFPGGGQDSGGSGGDASVLLKGKNSRPLKTPGGNPSGGGDSSDSDLPATLVEEHRDYALVCEITQNGALRFANRGSETMPSGVKIRWKAGTQRGAFRLNIDLEPGASAAAPDMFEDDSANSCWAAVI